MDFDTAFDRLIGHEGGYQNDPRDRGNWTSGIPGVGELRGTKWGISAMSYPTLDIRSLSREDARALYRRDVWGRAHLDELPGGLRFDIFDAAVHSGAGNAIRFAQRAVGVVDDGSVGPVTLAALLRTPTGEFLARFNGHRLRFLVQSGAWRTYATGWALRVAANLMAAGT